MSIKHGNTGNKNAIKSENNKRDARGAFRVHHTLKQALAEQATRLGISESKLVEKALYSILDTDLQQSSVIPD